MKKSHVISYSKRALEKMKGRTHELLSRVVQKHLLNVTKEYGINTVEADDAIWLWSRESCIKKKCHRCPVESCDPGTTVKFQRFPDGERKGRRDGKMNIDKTPNRKLSEFL